MGDLFKLTLQVTINPELATLVQQVLNVDEEVHPERAYKDFSVHDSVLHINICGTEIRSVRSLAISIVENIQLILKTAAVFPSNTQSTLEST